MIVRVALPVPLRKLFDYSIACELLPDELLGRRVRVQFGSRLLVGVIWAIAQETRVDNDKLKSIELLIDDTPVLGSFERSICEWVSQYYHHPIGDVVSLSVPKLFFQSAPLTMPTQTFWRLISGVDTSALAFNPTKKQSTALALLSEHSEGIAESELKQAGIAKDTLRRLASREVIESFHQIKTLESSIIQDQDLELSKEQTIAVKTIIDAIGEFKTCLLEGITGSGKTEVYLQATSALIQKKRQVLILVPEIGLAPQTLSRFQKRFSPLPVATYHSNMTDRERFETWMLAKEGKISIIIGTRSAIFLPLPQLGAVFVDEEHDQSFKQQDGCRYSAKDLAIVIGNRRNIPVVLGSATPSLETLYNVQLNRFTHLKLMNRAGNAKPPAYHVINMLHDGLKNGLSNTLVTAMKQTIASGHQVLLYLNRRGFSPVMMCHDCGKVLECDACDAKLVLHKQPPKLSCHHCDIDKPIPQQCECGSRQLFSLGYGTQRIEQHIAELFPKALTLRIDRDNTRSKFRWETMLSQIHQREAKILIGTQMLAKGHHFPGVSMVGILDIDHALFSPDFRAIERLGQLVTQVSGRAGREEHKGNVYIQTFHPEHPQLVNLLQNGYAKFAQELLAMRTEAALPPQSRLAILRVEGRYQNEIDTFLHRVKKHVQSLELKNIKCYGPMPANMERKAGRFRHQLMFLADLPGALRKVLNGVVSFTEKNNNHRQLRWAIDVDPQEI